MRRRWAESVRRAIGGGCGMRVLATAGVPPGGLACPPLRNPAAPLARSDEQTCDTHQNSCNCDDFFGGGCDCDEPDTQRCSYTASCDSNCNSCYGADCNTGMYGAAVHITRGSRAIPGPPNAFPTPPRTVHHLRVTLLIHCPSHQPTLRRRSTKRVQSIAGYRFGWLLHVHQ